MVVAARTRGRAPAGVRGARAAGATSTSASAAGHRPTSQSCHGRLLPCAPAPPASLCCAACPTRPRGSRLRRRLARRWQVDGWLTEAQARDLYDAAAAVARAASSNRQPPGPLHRRAGRHRRRRWTAIDPFPDDWRYGRPDTEEEIPCAPRASTGVDSRVDVRVSTGRDNSGSGWADRGAHGLRRRQARHVVVPRRHAVEQRSWRPARLLLVHDAFSSVGVTLADPARRGDHPPPPLPRAHGLADSLRGGPALRP